MSRDGTIEVSHLWKRFRPDFKHVRLDDQLALLGARLRGERRVPWLWALRDIGFTLEPGESLGLMGANGSGKSTLLKILTRVMYPYAGSVEATGRVGALIEVTTGLHQELTGRENVFLYGSLLGLKRREVADRFDAIVGFAELDNAVDRQVKFYSSGMKMRLGFGVAAFLEPHILLVDEVLAVGDASFQQRCLERMRQVLAQGTTLVYVSHDLPTIEATCSRGMWLEQGVVRADGPVREVLSGYRRSVEAGAELELRTDGDVRVVKASVAGAEDSAPRTTEPLFANLVLESAVRGRAKVFVGITEGPGTPVLLVSRAIVLEEGKTSVQCRFEELPLPRGRFFLWLGVFGKRGHAMLPWGPAAHFDVAGPDLETAPRGIVRLAPIYTEAGWEFGRPD
jgi:ABC-type polysaccharide/polyol phosphate transport system ATPase subunit